MKVLIISQYFWPESFRINDLATGLCELGHDVTVLTGKPNYPGGKFFDGYSFLGRNRESYKGVNIFRMPVITRGEGGGARLIANYLSFVIFSVFLAPVYCRDDYDIIFVYEPSPVTVGVPARLFGWLKRAPILFWVQDLWPESLSATNTTSNKFILGAVGKLVGWIYRGCNLILIQSQGFTDSIKSFGIEESRIKYFPNSAEELYKPIQVKCARESLGLPDGFVIMFAGNIGVAQDFNTILDAAEITKVNKDIQWVIIGDGRQFDWLRNEVVSRGMSDNFHLLGRQPIETMPDYFSCADVMLVSLKKEPIFSLTIPAKVQSYMACAKPVIAVLDGEGAKIIREANAGLAVGAEDSHSLAEAVITVSSLDKNELSRIGNNALKYYNQHFDRNMLINKLDVWMTDSIRKSY